MFLVRRTLLWKGHALGRGLFWLLLSILAVSTSHAELAIPPVARVTDFTQTLNPQQLQKIERDLDELEARKGAQIALLIVPTTQPETVEQYARRVLDTWKLGRKGIDDGALLLIAKDDRKLRTMARNMSSLPGLSTTVTSTS